ncbi:MBL fold metallo-hydrolase [Streptomyces sp. NPDC090499]|uniref:MBL fold metallo-hydrolase n=1 Tax=Streptomyces sp. NPDC090499 TaxID=3365965 RepID=UPI0038039047
MKLFDNLALLSMGPVSAMAVLTREGVVLIDALTAPEDAENVLVPGLRCVGARPEMVKYVVVTHGHFDHFGAAQYFADRYGARVLMSAADWDLLDRTRPANAPARDLEITDGQRITLGGTTLHFYHTPGHTAGTVSAILPVRAARERHMAMLWGGIRPPAAPGDLRTYLASIESFRVRMRQAGVDAELFNHPADYTLERVEQLHSRPGGPNPFILGQWRTQHFMTVMALMVRGRIADAEAPTT